MVVVRVIVRARARARARVAFRVRVRVRFFLRVSQDPLKYRMTSTYCIHITP